MPLVVVGAAATAPTLLAYNLPPSPTFLNQALAFGLWAAIAMVTAPIASRLRFGAPEAALLLLALAVALSWGPGTLPSTLALSALASLAAALLMLQAGRSASGPGGRGDAFAFFCWALVLAGAVNVAIALVQVFVPAWADGGWVAASALVGRAVGNLRQPNHLSSVLLWGCIGTVVLVQLRRLPWQAGVALLAAMVFAVVLSASRTGLVSVMLLAVWGLADRRMARPARLMLLAAPLVYALGWWLMTQWAASTQQAFGGAARLAETDISSSRFAIWADTLALIRAQPWLGVGWGQFNLAWALTPSPTRPTAFFDHAHNLPLHLAAEIGLPMATAVVLLLLGAFGHAARRAWAEEGDDAIARRGALMVVLMIGLHSLLEYPLWYSYFLLPAAWALGVALRRPGDTAAMPPATAAQRRPAAWVLAAGAWAVMAGTALSTWDYRLVADIFRATPGAPPLPLRIEAGQHSVLFGHHADYAAVTSNLPIPDRDAALARASHYLLDTRFMIAWARALHAAGDEAAARHLVARLREFRKPDADGFFAPCATPASAAGAFQCQPPPEVPLSWRQFAPPGP
ncbi:MAG: Wzy polymerase domain-containing protein [Burkholderiaceae bacterium]|nr:Wzy polymerase domain-containing protein [Burkholderiaceae bacterium]MCZ8175626.1 Wzy polymerase domain-containing protein [Burkholderiaceae bacterium]